MDWEDMDEKQQNAAYLKFRDLVGANLNAELSTFCEEFRRQRVLEKLSGHGDFLDEVDLEAKYRLTKPHILDNIYKNARKMWHPSHLVFLWEDVKYTSLAEAEQEYMSERKRKWEATQEFKKIKGEKKAKKIEDVVNVDKPKATKALSEPQIKRLVKSQEKMTKAIAVLQVTLDQSQDAKVAPMIPTYAIGKAVTAIKDSNKVATQIENVLVAKEGHAPTIFAMVTDGQQMLDAVFKSLEFQLTEAQAQLAGA